MDKQNIQVSSIIGQGKVNQLGGLYINGRPLSYAVREAIVEMYNNGEKPCNISRKLKVSHGAVSKILNRFIETGSIQPGQIGGTARTRKTVVHFEKEIKQMKEMNCDITAKEIRQNLIITGKCTRDNAPTESSIARRLTAYKRAKILKKNNENEFKLIKIDDVLKPGTSKFNHSIENILNSPRESNNSTVSSTTISTNDDSCTDDDESNKSTNGNNENKRNRTAFTSEQVKILEDKFEKQIYPDDHEKQEIIEATGLDLNRINTWFSNRRARFRKSCGYSLSTEIINTPPSIAKPQNLTKTIQQSQQYPFIPSSIPFQFDTKSRLLPSQLPISTTRPIHGHPIQLFQQPLFNFNALMFLQKLQQQQ